MQQVLSHGIGILGASWQLFVSAALYFLFGLVVAALISVFIRKETIGRHLGANRFGSVLKAALAGIPLPLCSCGVLPAAVSLRKEGASKAATVSFLISTPESGVDSIAVTYALFDPFMTIIRPVAAFCTAFFAGLMEILLGHREAPSTSQAESPACCSGHSASETPLPPRPAWRQRLAGGFRYAFYDLLADITPTFLLGIALGGVISYLIPVSFVETYLGEGLSAMLLMLVVGIPLYICASASTPIAAALVLKGMSPGAALVFLLAGPATNITALPVIAKSLGWRSVALYLGSIACCSLLFGAVTDLFYRAAALDIRTAMTHSHHPVSLAVQTGAAVLLLVLMVVAWVVTHRSASAAAARPH